jgi:large subunit ribosomal protein L28
MARRCDICGKDPQWGHAISHAHNVSNRRWLPNLQRVRVLVNGRTQQKRVCTRCIRSEALVKASRGRPAAGATQTP